MTSGAVAGQREPAERNIYLWDHPGMEAPNLYVVGRIATVLRLEQPCDPARTKMLGWEGRFEPLVCAGKSVLLVPLHDLKPEDRFLLLVTLADGTEIPFTVTSQKEAFGDRAGDQQVNVFRDHKAPHAVLASLNDSLDRERRLQEQNEQLRKQENSVDHAFATLLAQGAVKQTPFVQEHTALIKEYGVELLVRVYSGKGKAAVVFQIKNQSLDSPWRLMDARLFTESSGTPRPFALRMDSTEIAPGASGTLAVVADQSAFTSEKGPVDLALELFRHDGLQQAFVLLDHNLARK